MQRSTEFEGGGKGTLMLKPLGETLLQSGAGNRPMSTLFVTGGGRQPLVG